LIGYEYVAFLDLASKSPIGLRDALCKATERMLLRTVAELSLWFSCWLNYITAMGVCALFNGERNPKPETRSSSFQAKTARGPTGTDQEQTPLTRGFVSTVNCAVDSVVVVKCQGRTSPVVASDKWSGVSESAEL
jgi:hypothetical protein